MYFFQILAPATSVLGEDAAVRKGGITVGFETRPKNIVLGGKGSETKWKVSHYGQRLILSSFTHIYIGFYTDF